MTAPLGYWYGEDTYSLEAAAERLAAAEAEAAGAPLERLRIGGAIGAEISDRLADGINRLATGTLFGGGVLVLIDDPAAVLRSEGRQRDLIGTLGRIAPGNALAILELAPDPRRRPAALREVEAAVAAAGGQVGHLPALRSDQMVGWILERAAERTIRISRPAAALLAERIGAFVREGDIDRSAHGQLAVRGLEKLALYRAGGEIGREDVEQLVPEAIPASIWAFSDAVGLRRTRAASALADRILDVTPAPLLVAILARRIRELIEVRDLLAAGEAGPAIGRAMRIASEFRVRKLMEQARLWEQEELDRALEGLLGLDVLVKSDARDSPIRLALVMWLAEQGGRRFRGARGNSGAPMSSGRPGSNRARASNRPSGSPGA